MKNILYVDDTSEDRELMGLAFARSAKALYLETVASGELACEYFESSGRFANRAAFSLPDLVLLDLKMTGLSGFDVLRWLRKRPETAGLKVAIYSSSFLDSDVENSYKLGADFFITKPSAWPRQLEFVRTLQDCFISEPPELDRLRTLPEFKAGMNGKMNFSSSE